MKITIFLEKEDKTKKLEAKTVNELLKKLKINPETVLIIKENQPITKKTKLKNNDKLRIVRITSSG